MITLMSLALNMAPFLVRFPSSFNLAAIAAKLIMPSLISMTLGASGA